jgi:hypothetical protein
MSNEEKNRQAQNLLNEAEKIFKDFNGNGSTIDSAIKLDQKLTCFQQNFERFKGRFGGNDTLTKKLSSLVTKTTELLNKTSLTRYL